MRVLSRCVVAGLSVLALYVIGLATFFELRTGVAPGAVAASGAAGIALAVLAWTVLRDLFRSLRNAEELAASIVFERGLQPKGLRQQEALYARKILAFCQRYGRPLSIIGISWAAPKGSVGEFILRRPIATDNALLHRLLKTLRDSIRDSDAIILAADATRCFVVCPQTSAEQVLGFCRRVGSILDAIASDVTFQYASASLEQDGYSLDEMVEKCDHNLDVSPLNVHDAFPLQVIAAE